MRMPEARKKSLALSLQNIYETLAISWPTVIEALRGAVTKERCDDRLAGWCQRMVANTGATVEIVGKEHLASGKTFLVMSNHQSLYDVPFLFKAIGGNGNLRMITKK